MLREHSSRMVSTNQREQEQQDKMTAAQIYSNNNQSKRCIQVLHEVALHAASWVRADGPERVPVSFLW